MNAQEFIKELSFSGVAYLGSIRYAIKQSGDGTFHVERTTDGIREALSLGHASIPDAREAAVALAFFPQTETEEKSETAPLPEIEQARPTGMSVEQGKAFLNRPNQILGYEQARFIESQRKGGSLIPA